MQRVWERSVRLFDYILVAVVAHFVSVHADHGDLDWTCEIEVIEAQMIGCLLDLNLCQATCIVTHAKEDWASSRNCGVVRNKEEVKYIVTLLFNYHLIDYSAWKRITECPVLILNENSLRTILIH